VDIRRRLFRPDMTEHNAASAQNLTGVWHGMYTYPGQLGSVSFVATLIEAGSSLTGTTHEPSVLGDCPSDTLYATLLGTRQVSTVTFVKTYDGAGRRYHPVHYDGTLSDDGTEIEGRWSIPGNWSGKFLMIRSAGRQEEVSRKVFERA
jgi:hypothetical protein